MRFLTKIFFFALFASVCFAYYGDDLVRVVQNNVRLAQDSAPAEIRNAANIVHTLEIPMHEDGHYWTEANVNGGSTRFVVDTGASIITLSYDDAKKLNLPYFENDFDVVVNTAGGQTLMAEVTLDVVSVGVIELYNVKALVAQEGMLPVSLLGMNFLNQMRRFEFSNGNLIVEH